MRLQLRHPGYDRRRGPSALCRKRRRQDAAHALAGRLVGLRPREEIGFTPDGSRVVVVAGHASFSAAVAGSAWTRISPEHGATSPSVSDWPSISPDGRIVADGSPAGLVESIDGAPARAVRSPDGDDITATAFEPPGGLDKAFFFAASERHGSRALTQRTTGSRLRQRAATANGSGARRCAISQIGSSP